MRSVTVLFDDDCGFCRWSADRIRRWSRGNAGIVAIQSERGQALLRKLPPARRLDSIHAVTADGRVWPAGAAVPHVLRAMPGGRPLAAVAERFLGATERIYRAIATRRDAIGRLLGEQACRIRADPPVRR